MKSKIIEITGVGEILLERSRRAKHINLSVRPFQGARVAVPYKVSFTRAEEFAQSKAGWLKRHMDKMAVAEKEATELKKNNSINRREAENSIIKRLEELSERHGFNYNKVFVKNQKTRWGSCSGKNNINLNLNVALLPDELMDYVILHELVHTRIKDHSKRFWNELNVYVGCAKKLDRKLNNHKMLLLSSTQ